MQVEDVTQDENSLEETKNDAEEIQVTLVQTAKRYNTLFYDTKPHNEIGTCIEHRC